MAKEFFDIQAFFNFLNVLNDETKRVDSAGNPVSLLDNLHPGRVVGSTEVTTNLAVELAKIYTWYSQLVVKDTSTTPNTLKINPNALPDVGKDNIAEGYYYNGAFYSDSGHTTPITASADTMYIDIPTNEIYRYDTSDQAYEMLMGVNTEYTFREDQIPEWDSEKFYWTAATGGTQVTTKPANWASTYSDYYVSDTQAGTRTQVTTPSEPGSFTVYTNDGSAPYRVQVHRVATLDSSGKVPSSQLPSYVDDTIEGYYYNGAFYADQAHTELITGEKGKIYVDLTENKCYRWSGSQYIEISPNSDHYVQQDILSTNTNHPLLMAYPITTNTDSETNITYRNNSIYANPSTGTITATNFAGTINGYTIAANVPSGAIFTDENVKQSLNTDNKNYPLLLSSRETSDTTTDRTGPANRNNSIYANPSTGTITATNFAGTINGYTISGNVAKAVPADAVFTDTKVTQNIKSDNKNYPILLSYYETSSSTTTAQTVNRNDGIYANPSTGTITATKLVGENEKSNGKKAVYEDDVLILHCTQNPSVIPST